MTLNVTTTLPVIAGETSNAVTQTMICGDCLTVLRTMPTASVKTSVFSPPYNLKKKYGLYDDDKPEAVYLADMGNVARELRRATKPDGHCFLNCGWNSKNQWRSIDVLRAYRPFFELQNSIAWIKSVAIDGTSLPEQDMISLPASKAWMESVGLPTSGKAGKAVRQGLCAAMRTDMHERTIGQFTSLTSDYYLNSGWENIWHLTPTGRSPIDRQATGVKYVWGNQPDRFGHHRKVHCRGDAVMLPYDTVQSNTERSNHPSSYPIELALMCLKLSKLEPGDLVLDPYAGTGTTLVAAKMLGFNAIGIEIDPAYVAAAEERLRQTA